jgi:hypothetical protein
MMSGACGRHGRNQKCIEILVGKSEGKNPLRTAGINIKEKGFEVVDWIRLAWDGVQS